MVSWASSPRLLLLLFVLAGVAGMHTLGHADPVYVGHSATGHHEAATLMALPLAQPGDDSAAPGEACEHDHCMVMDPMSFCLAVLLGGILLLFAAAILRLRRSDSADEGDMPATGGAGRGPPAFALRGLIIADLSVQRT